MNTNQKYDSTYDTLQSVIKTRQTMKVLARLDSPVDIAPEICAKNRPLILEAIRVAGWAPFHYARNVDSIAEPWRFHVLWHPACRKIARDFLRCFPDSKPNNKLPAMLSACGAVVIVNWLPQPDLSESTEQARQVNEEHLAATAAAVQNLLLLLTALNMGTYWSSGGQLRTPEMFRGWESARTSECWPRFSSNSLTWAIARWNGCPASIAVTVRMRKSGCASLTLLPHRSRVCPKHGKSATRTQCQAGTD